MKSAMIRSTGIAASHWVPNIARTAGSAVMSSPRQSGTTMICEYRTVARKLLRIRSGNLWMLAKKGKIAPARTLQIEWMSNSGRR